LCDDGHPFIMRKEKNESKIGTDDCCAAMEASLLMPWQRSAMLVCPQYEYCMTSNYSRPKLPIKDKLYIVLLIIIYFNFVWNALFFPEFCRFVMS